MPSERFGLLGVIGVFIQVMTRRIVMVPTRNNPFVLGYHMMTMRVFLPVDIEVTLSRSLLNRPSRMEMVGDYSTPNFSIDLTVAETLAVNLNNPWTSPEVATQQSSIYFLVRDPLVGPTEQVWWDDADSEYVV